MIKLNDLAIGYNGEAILEHIDQEFDDGLIYGSVRAPSLAARPRSPRQSPPPARRTPLIP